MLSCATCFQVADGLSSMRTLRLFRLFRLLKVTRLMRGVRILKRVERSYAIPYATLSFILILLKVGALPSI